MAGLRGRYVHPVLRHGGRVAHSPSQAQGRGRGAPPQLFRHQHIPASARRGTRWAVRRPVGWGQRTRALRTKNEEGEPCWPGVAWPAWGSGCMACERRRSPAQAMPPAPLIYAYQARAGMG